MNILIIGAGVVGQATGRGFARYGHQVAYSDIDGARAAALRAEGLEALTLSEAFNRDRVWNFVMVCTPEGVVDQVVRQVMGLVGPWPPTGDIPVGPIVIRSSIMPGQLEKLVEKYRWPMVFNPEFLRAVTSEEGFLKEKFAVIGYPEPLWFGRAAVGLEVAYRAMQKTIIKVPAPVASFAKLANNSFLAACISFWNEMHDLAGAEGINSHEVGALLSTIDERMPEYGAKMHGQPYGGTCLPKDIRHLIEIAGQHNRVPALLQAVEAVNHAKGGPRA